MQCAETYNALAIGKSTRFCVICYRSTYNFDNGEGYSIEIVCY